MSTETIQKANAHNNHHGHDHSHDIPDLKDISRAFYIGIALNAIFTVIEFVVGYRTNSLALLADASHNLSDVASLIISLIGMKLAQKASSKLYTYGYKKASILASLINAVLLIVIVVNIIKVGFERLGSAPELMGTTIIITALIGVFINCLSAYLFYKGQKDDINVKGAFIHLMVDALISVGVVFSGIIIYFTGWNLVDPLISFVIAIMILFSTWALLKESVKLVLNGVPQNIDLDKVKQLLTEHELVNGVHHLHVWALSSSENAATVHVVLEDQVEMSRFIEIKKSIKDKLWHENIQHVTIELEDSSEHCEHVEC